MTNPKKPLVLPEQQWLKDRFEYDPDRGLLIWKVRPLADFPTEQGCRIFNAQFAGKVAGSSRPDGYRRVKIGNPEYLLHRLIYVYHNGEIPDGYCCDHKDGDPSNNKIDNIRIATRSQNSMNQKERSNGSGVRGVYKPRNKKFWIAQIEINGVHHYLGSHASLEQAANARAEAEKKLFGEYSLSVSREAA
ncbi:HNH endonuclease signature motif containing protein [Pseudogemmobacter bohemicus]|uniref:HNH endonuclease signature motif containing protein n=1 Tax=Pseudogemmobacter bohemicus TaxID=2250708 RepID=UPI000DD41A4E|nr:HNH endonuclease signature motif containing protein [Pseudogemmobacter bohemicus]